MHNKIRFSTFLVSTLILTYGNISNAFPTSASTTIGWTGKLTIPTCTLANDKLTFDFPSFSQNDFKGKGTVIASKSTTLLFLYSGVSDIPNVHNCNSYVNNVSFSIEPTQSDLNDRQAILNKGSAGTNVGVKVRIDDVYLEPSGSAYSVRRTNAALGLFVEIVQTGENKPMAGTIQSNFNLIVAYL